ncbi:hypothetical protein PC119_g16178 [Phytophthora cactorum]|nr:hypothetical protein PC119_g16178 [Phytophthora cactorum]
MLELGGRTMRRGGESHKRAKSAARDTRHGFSLQTEPATKKKEADVPGITERDSVTTEVSAHTTQQPVIRIKSIYGFVYLNFVRVARRHIITGPADGNASELAESIDTMSATRRARNALQTAGYYPDLGEFWVVHCVIGRTG